MAYDEIAAFFLEHSLPADLVGPLAARLAPAAPVPTEAYGNATLSPDDEPRTEPAPPSPERHRYEDLGPLGAGGMGEVRRVRDLELGRTCALKSLHTHLASWPGALARFIEETQVGAQLQHPNIPPIYDAGRLADGRPWFTMR